MPTVTRKKYVCTNCEAEDTIKLFVGESAPACVNCWKCHAGFNKRIDEMLADQIGMFPAQD